MTFKIAEAVSDLNLRVVAIKGGSKGPSEKGWPNTQVRVDDWLAENGGDLQFDRENEHRYGIVLDSDTVVVDLGLSRRAGKRLLQACLTSRKKGGPDIFENCGLDRPFSQRRVVTCSSGGRDPSVKIPKSCKSYPAIDLLTEGAQGHWCWQYACQRR